MIETRFGSCPIACVPTVEAVPALVETDDACAIEPANGSGKSGSTSNLSAAQTKLAQSQQYPPKNIPKNFFIYTYPIFCYNCTIKLLNRTSKHANGYIEFNYRGAQFPSD